METANVWNNKNCEIWGAEIKSRCNILSQKLFDNNVYSRKCWYSSNHLFITHHISYGCSSQSIYDTKWVMRTNSVSIIVYCCDGTTFISTFAIYWFCYQIRIKVVTCIAWILIISLKWIGLFIAKAMKIRKTGIYKCNKKKTKSDENEKIKDKSNKRKKKSGEKK